MAYKFSTSGLREKLKNAHKTALFAWIAFLISFLSLIIASWTLYFPVQSIQETTSKIENDLAILQKEMKSNSAEDALRRYFYLIESGKLHEAWQMQTIDKQQNTGGGYEGFEKWLEFFVAFEDFKLLRIRESVSTQVFLVEFNFKERGMKPIESKWGIHMKWDGDEWKVDYTSVYYENGWKKEKEDACSFYPDFSICK